MEDFALNCIEKWNTILHRCPAA